MEKYLYTDFSAVCKTGYGFLVDVKPLASFHCAVKKPLQLQNANSNENVNVNGNEILLCCCVLFFLILLT